MHVVTIYTLRVATLVYIFRRHSAENFSITFRVIAETVGSQSSAVGQVMEPALKQPPPAATPFNSASPEPVSSLPSRACRGKRSSFRKIEKAAPKRRIFHTARRLVERHLRTAASPELQLPAETDPFGFEFS
jgi:hypothetical protein